MGRRWTKEEEEYLLGEAAAGSSIASIARVLNRTFEAVLAHLKFLRRVEKGRKMQEAKTAGRSLDQLVEDIHAWQTETFVDGTEEGRIAHFLEEIREYLKNPGDGEEAADVFLLFIAIIKNRGIDLRAESERKLEINKARTWAKVAGGYSKHVGGNDGE